MSILSKLKSFFVPAPVAARKIPTWPEYEVIVPTMPPVKEKEVEVSEPVELLPLPELLPPAKKQLPMTLYIESVLQEEQMTPVPVPEVVEQQFRYNETPFFSMSMDGEWFTRYEPPQTLSNVRSWREENELVARGLLNEHEGALCLFYDGTLASQLMIRAFADAGEVPRVYAARFNKDEEDPILMQLYRELNFPLRIVDLDPNIFWKIAAKDMSSQHNMLSSVEVLRLWASQAAAGVPVLAGGIPYIKNFGGVWGMADHEQYFIVERLVREAGASVIPSFFRRSEEQLIAFLSQAPSLISELGHIDSFSCENELMKRWYPELVEPEGTVSTAVQIFEFDAQVTIRDHVNICWHEIRNLHD